MGGVVCDQWQVHVYMWEEEGGRVGGVVCDQWQVHVDRKSDTEAVQQRHYSHTHILATCSANIHSSDKRSEAITSKQHLQCGSLH